MISRSNKEWYHYNHFVTGKLPLFVALALRVFSNYISIMIRIKGVHYAHALIFFQLKLLFWFSFV